MAEKVDRRSVRVNGKQGPVDKDRIAAAVREILIAVGEDPDRDGLLETPQRVARMYEELFSGLHQDPSAFLRKTFIEKYDEMVLVKDIQFGEYVRASSAPVLRKGPYRVHPEGAYRRTEQTGPRR
ncbi:MAG: GTP cyclohydrolase I [Gemmataceae bacterium]